MGPGSRMPGSRPRAGCDPRAFRGAAPAMPARMATSAPPAGVRALRTLRGRGVWVSGLPGCPLGGVQGAVPERPQEVLLAAPAEPVGRAPQGLASLLRRRPRPPTGWAWGRGAGAGVTAGGSC